MRDSLTDARGLYLYATKQKGEGHEKTRYLLARLSALYAFLEVMYPSTDGEGG